MARSDVWEVGLLDRKERVKAHLPRARGGSLSWSIFKAVAGSGSIELTHDPEVPISWLTDRVRVTHVNGARRTPMGVWLISMPGWETEGPVTRTTLALLDKCEALNTPIGSWLTYAAGTVVTTQVVAIIHARGETSISVAPSTATLRAAMSWEPEVTWLTVTNDLLASINYGSLWADMDGRLRVEPYVAPADRPVTFTYGGEPGDLKMRADWTSDADLSQLPTGARIYVPGTETTAGFIGKADLPDSHPLSAVSRGSVDAPDHRLLVEHGEAASLEVANQIAARRLDESLQVTQRVTVTHPVDASQVNDVIHHRPLALDAAIVERTVTLGQGAVVADVIRHIYTGGELPWAIH